MHQDHYPKLFEQARAFALVVCILSAALQLLYLSQSFDAYQLVQNQDGLGWRAVFGYFGQLAKLGSLFAFLLGLALHQRIKHYWEKLIQDFNWSRFFWFLPLQFVSYVPIYFLSGHIFNADKLIEVSSITFILWLTLFVIWTYFGLLATNTLRSGFLFLAKKARLILAVFILALLVWSLANLSTGFWGPLSGFTFELSAALLAFLIGTEIYVDPGLRNLGLDEFVVNIAPACSGYEGIGLVCSFIALYLYINKKEFKFPQAFLLFPIGAAVIWLLNVVRIVVLIIIGEYWSADVAVGGFHSQAGWLTFILASLGLLWVANVSPFFSKSKIKVLSGANTQDPNDAVEDADIAIAALVPMVVLLAIILLSSALNAGFDWLYPLRVIGVIAAIVLVWPKFEINASSFAKFRRSHYWESFLVGIAVAILWCLMLSGASPEQDRFISTSLDAQNSWLAISWLVFRFLGTAITVPIAEELAFRAYLLCKLSGQPVSINHKLPLSVVAVLVSSLAFGFLHGAWFAGTLAGILYAFVRYRTEHVFFPIFAHAITNTLIFFFAAIFGQWSLL